MVKNKTILIGGASIIIMVLFSPQIFALNYEEYLLEKCNPPTYLSSSAVFECLMKNKKTYFEYNDLKEYAAEKMVVEPEKKLLSLHHEICIGKGYELLPPCKKYETYLDELEKYKDFPGYLGIGFELLEPTEIDKSVLAEYFNLDFITNVTKNTNNTYVISGLENKKWVWLIKTQIKREITFDIQKLTEIRPKSIWETFLTDDESLVKSNNDVYNTSKLPRTQQFEDNLHRIRFELNAFMKNTHNDLRDYTLKYNVISLRGAELTNETINDMEEKEAIIRKGFLDIQKKTHEYKLLRKKVDLTQLSAESKKISEEIDSKSNVVLSNEEDIKACLLWIEGHRRTFTMLKEINELIDTWEIERDIILELGEDEMYSKVLRLDDDFQDKTSIIIEKLEGEYGNIMPLAWAKILYFKEFDDAFKFYTERVKKWDEGFNFGDWDEDVIIFNPFYSMLNRTQQRINSRMNDSERVESTKEYMASENRGYQYNISVCLEIFEENANIDSKRSVVPNAVKREKQEEPEPEEIPEKKVVEVKNDSSMIKNFGGYFKTLFRLE